jgi:Domain of Unknown Function (DUF1080)
MNPKKLLPIVTRACTTVILLLLFGGVSHSRAGNIPEGFTPVFNGKDLTGWHFSKTTHHGSNGTALVQNGELILKQHPFGEGGLLFTNKRYHNFEFYVEVFDTWGCNSGIFLRSTEGGSSYQIELNNAETGGTGNLIGELMHVSKGAQATDLIKVWKYNDWNTFRVRMVGDAPEVTLWINGVQMWDAQEPQNDKIAGETDGFIGLQLHWYEVYQPNAGGRNMNGGWRPDAGYRFRNMAIKELP